jgi:hypothetical protein
VCVCVCVNKCFVVFCCVICADERRLLKTKQRERERERERHNCVLGVIVINQFVIINNEW